MYDEKAEQFEAHAANSIYNAHYDRPAVLSMLGDVDGLDVLDAGCGPGIYAEELLARGARVTGFDASAPMVELARRRLGTRADIRQATLGDALPYADGSFDAAVCALVIHHVDERVAAYREIHRVLRPGARFVLSTVHPVSDWLRLGGSYFTSEVVEEEWPRWGMVRYHRQPLTEVVDELADAGFVVERLLEPQPLESGRAVDEDDYDKLVREPGFIVFRLRKSQVA
ncbi:MAG TPA: methyltransferase domain-containing protein [Acidimicrobiales bacterium]|nr:methyltransferase domain-containing protein [Acidimicrobiales bacterium]